MISKTSDLLKSRTSANAADGQLVRWMLALLSLVFVFDLISSPFHAHHHTGGPDSYTGHAADASHFASHQAAEHDNRSMHVDSDDMAHSGGHSMSALQGTLIKLSKAESVTKALALVPLFVFFGLLTQPIAEGVVRWRPGRDSVSIPLFRTVPPDGRAPPSLHA